MAGNRTGRWLAHAVFGIRRFNDTCIRAFAADVHGARVLELGSGRPVNGRYLYSARCFFDDSNTFVCSDIDPSFGHRVVDVTTLAEAAAYDVILCLNVLEHVYDFHAAVARMFQALKPGGRLALFLPGYYPLHDEPHDYWRFTEHAIRRLLAPHAIVAFRRRGLRQYPIAYFAVARR